MNRLPVSKEISAARAIIVNDCFALRDDREYYVARNECYALKYPEFRKIAKAGHCGNRRCPFYKPSRANIRIDNDIYRNASTRKEI